MKWAGVTSLVTAVTAVGALVFTGLSLNATRDQVSIAEQGLFTDRFSRAVDQLGQQGADRLQVRLGGIYSLERLARNSPRDHGTIVDVLAAFVRSTTSVFHHGKYVGCPSTALDAADHGHPGRGHRHRPARARTRGDHRSRPLTPACVARISAARTSPT